MLVEIARNTSSFAKYLPRKISERLRGWASRAARVPLLRSRATAPDVEASPMRKVMKPGGTLTKRNVPDSRQEALCDPKYTPKTPDNPFGECVVNRAIA